MSERGAKTKAGEITRSEEDSFSEIARMIDTTRERTLDAVNSGLIDLYWQLGQLLSRRIETAAWGEGVVDRLASYAGAYAAWSAWLYTSQPLPDAPVL